MILIDANLLLYASHDYFAQHKNAIRWLDEQLNGSTPVGIPWPSLLAFVRLSTQPRVLEKPLNVVEAWRQVEQWLSVDKVWTPSPTDAHQSVLARLLKSTFMTSNLVNDAHLAALAIEHGLLLCSADNDFARFDEVKWSNPLKNA